MVKKKPKILIITASFGSGHNQVANVLLESFRKKGIQDIKIYDLFKEAYPYANEMVRFLHIHSFKFGSPFYQLFYYGTNKLSSHHYTNWYLNLGKRKLKEIILNEQPNIIINTFPILAVPYLKKKKKNNIQIYTVMTDFCLHHAWIQPEMDTYYVATEDLKEKLIESKIPNENVVVSGIPVRKGFEQRGNLSMLRKKYHLQSKKKSVLLIAGITFSTKKIKDFIFYFFKKFQEQLLIVCGNNQKLYEEIHTLQKRFAGLRVFRYVQNIHELYEVSDFMITKPGGITLSECVSKQLPPILFKPVPGQEKENALFFEEHGGSIIVNSPEELFENIRSLFQNEKRIVQMEHSLAKLNQTDSDDIITDDVLQKYYTINPK